MYISKNCDSKLEFTVFIFGWLLPKIHSLFRTIQGISIRNLVKEITDLKICPGLFSEVTNVNGKNRLLTHVVPRRVDYKNNPDIPILSTTFHRSVKCMISPVNINLPQANNAGAYLRFTLGF